MSIDLILEVMDHAPADLTSGERLVLVVIAERANDKTRIAKQSSRWSLDTIAKRAGVKRTGLKSIFQGLARKGCEVRIPVKFTPDGKPVFAFEGTAVTFKMPHLAERSGHSIPTERGGQDIPTQLEEGMPQHPRGEAVASERGGHDHPQSLMTLKEPSNTSSLSARTSVPAPRDPADDRERDDSTTSEDQNLTEQQQIVINDGGCPPHLAQLVVDYTEMEHNVRTIVWWRRVKTHGDAPRIVREALNALPDNIDSPGDFTRDDTPCPLHPRCRARNCQSCWGDVKAGQDPYRHQPELRPAWFKETYNLQPRTSQRGPDGTRVNMPDGARTAAWERRRAEHRQDAPPGYSRRPDGRLLLTDSHDPNIDWEAKI